MKRLLLPVLPCLLGSCALLEALPGVGPHEALPPPARTTSSPSLRGQAQAVTAAQGVRVALTLLNVGTKPLTLRYAAQVNWSACGLPPYVALSRGDGAPVAAPAPEGRLTCPELQFTRSLDPGEALTLRRTLPPLPPGTYTLTA